MKYILITLLLINHAYACMNKISYSEAVKAINLEVAKAGCQPNEECLCYDTIDFRTHDLVDNMIDNPDAPIYEIGEIILEDIIVNECDEEDDECEPEISQVMTCADGFELIESQCKQLVGYEQMKSGHKFVLNESKKSSLEAKEQAEQAKANALAVIRKFRKAGEEIIDLMILRNAQKNLSAGQKKQVLQAYHDIKELLSVGNLTQAKIEIQNANIDGIMVTEDDKQALIEAIDKHL
jgi:hypothetical protein